MVGVLAYAGIGRALQGTPVDRQSLQVASGTKTTLHKRMKVAGGEWGVVSFTNSEGKLCLGIQTPGGRGISCTTRTALFSRGPLAIDTGWTSEGGSGASWVWGVAQPGVNRVILQFTDCSHRSLGVDQGGFFLTVTPGSADQPQPQRAIAIDVSGTQLGAEAVVSAGAKARPCSTK